MEAVRKTLKSFFQDDAKYKVYDESWTKSLEDLERRNNIAESIPWLPLPALGSTEAPRRTATATTAVRNVEQRIREIVPQVVHPGWSTKDKTRANEVSIFCMAQN